jgi:phospholipid-binding lipoprotein MlaA
MPKPQRIAPLFAVLFMLGVSACGPASIPPGDRVNDVHESQNRATHEFNIGLDRVILRPTSRAYAAVVPRPLRQGVRNVASNLDLPGYVINDILQLQLGDAGRNTARFVVNSTIGIGGLFDPATAIGLEEESTDFGETLHVYGVREGDYLVMPVIGPTTERDLAGRVVDAVLNPFGMLAGDETDINITPINILATLDSRAENANLIDEVLYESVDGYTQLRSFYLQNRRFALRGGSTPVFGGSDDGGDGVENADEASAVANTPSDAYFDPYFDPYAQ